MTKLTKKKQEAKKRFCFALDVPTTDKALNLVKELSDYVEIFKVGKQLHTVACNEGVPIISEIRKLGGKVFPDLKLMDTPHTIYGTSKELSIPGVFMFNIHLADATEEMCDGALKGAYDGAKLRGIKRPKVIGVTVLTSLNDNDLRIQYGSQINYDKLIEKRTFLAKKWGLDGVVCPANKAGHLEKIGYHFIKVTPGIEWEGIHRAGQKQLYTPDLAVRDCKNSILVVGEAITQTKNKRKTAYEILKAMAENI